MTERDRLIELINKYPCMSTAEDFFMESIAEDLADYLLQNGVRVIDIGVINPENRELITHFAGMPINDVLDLVRVKKEGRLIVPPCRVGDIVYLLYPVRKGVYEAFIDEICVMKESNFIVTRDIYFNRRQSIFFEQIGKTVFLTKEEAEKALKEREQG